MPSNPPNASIYVKNLNFSIKKPELRSQLFTLFSTYGKVIDVVATRANGMRGQAFIVFKDLQASTAALRALDGFQFYDKPMSIDYAKFKSNATLIQEHGPAALYNPMLFNSDPKSANLGGGKVTVSSAQAEARGREKKRAREEAGGAEEEQEEEVERGSKVQKTQGDDDNGEMEMEEDSDNEEAPGPQPLESQTEATTTSSSFGPPIAQIGDSPNTILFCSDLPSEITDDMLGVLFQQYPGFKSVQLFPARASRSPPEAYSFIEFDSPDQASVAKEALDQFKLTPEKSLFVHWAKRGD